MRTPGEDFELAIGFLYAEGIIEKRDDVIQISYCHGEEPQNYNIVLVKLASGVEFDSEVLARNFYQVSYGRNKGFLTGLAVYMQLDCLVILETLY